MNPTINRTVLAGTLLVGLTALGLGGCGRQGPLEQPAPLFGERAKQDYQAQKASQGVRINDERNAPKTPVADQSDPNADNVAPSRRELQAPEQKNVPLRQEPIPGEPDLVGPPPSMNPPGGV